MSISLSSNGDIHDAISIRFHKMLQALAQEHDREVGDLRTQLVHAQNLLVIAKGDKRKSVPSGFYSDMQKLAAGVAGKRMPQETLNLTLQDQRYSRPTSASAAEQSSSSRSGAAPRRRSQSRTVPASPLPGAIAESREEESHRKVPAPPPPPDSALPRLPELREQDLWINTDHVASSMASGRHPPKISEASSLLSESGLVSHTKAAEQVEVPLARNGTESEEKDEEMTSHTSSHDEWCNKSHRSDEFQTDTTTTFPLNEGSALALMPEEGEFAQNKLSDAPLSGPKSTARQKKGSLMSVLSTLAWRGPKRVSRSKDSEMSTSGGVSIEKSGSSPVKGIMQAIGTVSNRASNDKQTATFPLKTDGNWSSLELSSSWQIDLENDKPEKQQSNATIATLKKQNTLIRGWVTEFEEEEKICCSSTKFIATPSSTKRLMWEIFGFGFLIYDMIMIPLQVYEPEETSLMAAIGMACTIFWTLDILASFAVGYHVKGFIEMRPSMIALRYLKSWFILDVSIVATDWGFFAISQSSRSKGSAGVMRFTKLSRSFRVLRLLRIAKFHVILTEMIQRIHSEYKRTMIGIMKIVFFIVIVNHFIACGFYGLKFLRDDLQTDKYWVNVNFDDSDGLGYRYWTSMHWSLTQFTPASMEVVPRNSLERFYTVLVMFVALITFSSFISSITNAMTRLRQINASQMEQESILHRYLSQHNISRPLVARILHLIQERHTHRTNLQRSSKTKEEDVGLFQTLPDSLKNEVRCEAYSPTLCAHPLFHEYSVCETLGMRRITRAAVKERSLILHEELFAAGRSVTDMVWVSEGVLQYTSINDAMAIVETNTAGSGAWLCEACLWAEISELPFPFTAMRPCEIVTLNAKEFGRIVRKYVVSARFVAAYAKRFMEFLGNGCNEDPWKALCRHDPEMLRTMVHDAAADTHLEDHMHCKRIKHNSKKRNSAGGDIFTGLLCAGQEILNIRSRTLHF